MNNERRVQVYGCIRSGTNVIEEMLLRNLDCVPTASKQKESPYAKHHAHFSDSIDADLIICVRNIWEWLPSIHRLTLKSHWHRDIPESFSEFIREPWSNTSPYDGMEPFANPIKKWAADIRFWLSLPNEKMVVKNEDVIRDYNSVVRNISERFNLPIISDEVITRECSPKVYAQSEDGQFRRGDDILNRKVLSEYTDDDLAYVLNHLDIALIDELDYDEWHTVDQRKPKRKEKGMNKPKKKATTAHKLKVAEQLLKSMGVSDSMKELYDADADTVKAASEGMGRDVQNALRAARGNPIDWEAEYKALELPTVDEMQKVDTVDEFKAGIPHFCIGECIVDFTANVVGNERQFRKGERICMTGGDYRKMNNGQRCMKPAAESFRKTFRRYDGQDLTDKHLMVWRAGGIGDLLFIRPILVHLKRKYPTCTITLSTKEQYHDLVKYWEDAIDNLTDVYFNCALTYDLADYHLSFEGIIERCREAETTDVHDLFARLAGIDPDEVEWCVPMTAPVDNPFFAAQPAPYALVQCRASAHTRTPFTGYFIEAINACTKAGMRVVISDREGMWRFVEDIRTACADPDMVINFAKFTTGLHDMVSLVDYAAVVIAPDSAFCHAAAMQNKPCVAFYGPFPAYVRTARYPLCIPLEPVKSQCCPWSGRECFIHAHETNQCQHNNECWNNLDREAIRDTVRKVIEATEL